MVAGVRYLHAAVTTEKGAVMSSDILHLMSRIGQYAFTSLSVAAVVGAAVLLILGLTVL
jgi:hypothetical protein